MLSQYRPKNVPFPMSLTECLRYESKRHSKGHIMRQKMNISQNFNNMLEVLVNGSQNF